ncbi:acyl-CoA N-acyltransferase [Flagelloscypha sp. PMI_526]|nr:acyl-CoA N-acyltransferase [Flagelloscypha sp. PMI_526]
MFETTRLILRGYDAPRHKETLTKGLNNFQMYERLTNRPLVPASEKDIDGFINNMASSQLLFAMLHLKEQPDVVVGWVHSSLDSARSRNGQFGIALFPEFWGNGFAREVIVSLLDYAFDNLGYHRMGLSVHSGNTRAMHLYQRIGFVEEGRVRETIYQAGKWEDSVKMGLLKKEWKPIKQRSS